MLSLPKKAIARVRRMARMVRLKYIPYHPEFKPKGVRKLREGSRGVTVMDIHPAYTSALDLPEKFLEDCSAYSRPPVTIDFPASFVASIRNGRIFAHDVNNFAVVTEDNYVLDEASFQWVDAPVPVDQNMVFKAKGFTTPRKYAGTVFSLLTMGAARQYYFHWMFDAIAKLDLLKASGLFDSVDYFLVPNYKYGFNREYLSHFDIPEHKIINGLEEDHIQADNLIVTSEVRREEHLPKWACDFYYNNFVTGREVKNAGRRIYIARGDAARNRKLSNEAELIEVLKKQGFEILYLTRVAVKDQVKIFNDAAFIVAVHGGGLSNLVFCEPGTTVLEIFPDQYVRHYFYEISVKRGLSYHYMLCESEKPCDNHFDGEIVGLTADIDAIMNKINSLTSRSHIAENESAKLTAAPTRG